MNKVNMKLDGVVFDYDFLLDDVPEEHAYVLKPYKIFIVDDDEEVHLTTKLILKDFTFEGRKLEFIEAYNTADTISIMEKNPDTALILLDVVMDENDSGLKLVEYIRNIMGNSFVRIIIRTGQPGEAPEEKIIVNYDINDYLMKTEVTMQRLFTSLYQALRSYRDILKIEKNRKGLEKIIKSSSRLFVQESVQEFFNCILKELMSFCKDDSSICIRVKNDQCGFIYLDSGEDCQIIAATGNFEKYLGREINKVTELTQIYTQISNLKVTNDTELVETSSGFVIFKKNMNNIITAIYVESDLDNYDIELIKVFLTNFSLALDSYIVNQQMLNTQVEIIHTLGDVIENRSHETANHVSRVSETSYLIGKKLGMSEDASQLLKIASTMHDVGKIGISDNILLKPGKLTVEEFELIKNHTTIGFKIFNNSKLAVLRKAAEICLNHHERYDGTGYPKGLKGEDIPIEARIVSVVDVFDALTHIRCYKNAWSIPEATEYLINQRGLQFDPQVVNVFIDNLEELITYENEV